MLYLYIILYNFFAEVAEMDSRESKKMKVFPKGQVVIPVSLRRRYRIEIGDKIDVVPTPEGILLKSDPAKGQAESMTERLFGVFSDFAGRKRAPTKEEIGEATEKGFLEEWPE
jgi:AbrB family looped-hinge helix DNA binding protein